MRRAMRPLAWFAAVLVVVHARASSATSNNATCGDGWRGGEASGLVLVYVVGAARSLAANAGALEALFCGGDPWAGRAAVVPLLHAWAGSACAGAAPAVPASFGGGLANATMDDMGPAMRALVARERAGTDEHRRALAYVAQLFHLYTLNRRALRLVADAGLGALVPRDPGRTVVVRWRPDATVRDAATTRRFLGACADYVRSTPDVVCVLPTGRSREVPAKCLRRHKTFHVATCCHRHTSGVLSDWVFVALKRVFDALDGERSLSFRTRAPPAAALFRPRQRVERGALRRSSSFPRPFARPLAARAGRRRADRAPAVRDLRRRGPRARLARRRRRRRPPAFPYFSSRPRPRRRAGGADQLGLAARRCEGNVTETPFHEVTGPAR